MKKIKVILYLLTLFILLLPVGVLALENEYPEILGQSLPKNSDIADYVSYFANIGISISAILAGLVIIFGGIQYMVFRALGKSTSDGKDWLKSGLLGLFLLVSAYIILATINPVLVNPTIGKLLDIIPFVNIPASQLNQGPPITYFKEIPIGTLTETVLSRTIDCYDFDEMGDPIQIKIKNDNGAEFDGPSLLKKDRIECMLKLNEAIEKKSKIAKQLSLKIAKIMQSCSCDKSSSSSSSSSSLPPETDCKSNSDCPSSGVTDVNKCLEEANCGEPLPCDCQGNCEPDLNEFSMCRAGTKKLVKEGPIELGGLDWSEFVASLIAGGNPNTGAFMFYANSLYSCMTSKSSDTLKPKKYKGLQEFYDDNLSFADIITLVETQKIKVENRDVILINNTNWHNLKLAQQLIYLKEKLNLIARSLNQDTMNLESARSELSECYLTTPYVDYLKKVEQAKKEDSILMVEENYNSYENRSTDISKYCNGFGFANSSCFYNCENACPSSDIDNLSIYKNCRTEDCDAECFDGPAICTAKRNVCIKNENNCLATSIFLKESCNNDSSGKFNNFQGCIDNCKTNCNEDCKTKFKSCSEIFNLCKTCSSDLDSKGSYPAVCPALSKKYCSDELEKCQTICNYNSQCVLDNKEKCLYNPQSLIDCATFNTDSENLKNCVENSGFTCKYGSSQNAGYAECLEKPYSLQDKFSSSDIYKGIVKGQDHQKCPDPYSKEEPDSYCIDFYPETSKCPSASNCPDCPCTTLPLNIAFQSEYSGSYSSSTDLSPQITDYQIINGDCQEYKYNDDPLTFYCKQDWWNDPELKKQEPLTNELICPKDGEIPIGQTVDNTQIWATKLLNYESGFILKTDELIKHLKKIADLDKSDNYCKCGSDCGNSEKTCNAPCVPNILSTINPDGSTSESCVCTNQGCQGNPCRYMINLLLGKPEISSCPKNELIDGPVQIYEKIQGDLKIISDFILKSRTDILKQLIYSRNKIDNCSVASKVYAEDEQPQLLNCQRAGITNFISPLVDNKTIINNQEINYPCYGASLGEIFGQSFISSSYSSSSTKKLIIPKTDNWFCCVPRD